MSSTQAERAVNQLYESDTLRSELRDEEASLLLHWGETHITELAQRDLPDSQFDQLNEGLRALLAAINVCVGKRKTSPSQHLSMMATISSAAESAGFTLPPDDQTGFLKHQAVLANQDAISELLGLLKPVEATQPPSQTIGEAVAELAPSEPAPTVVDNTLPQPSESTPAAVENAAPQPPEPAPVVEDIPQQLMESTPAAVDNKPPQSPESAPIVENSTQQQSPEPPEPTSTAVENAAPQPPEPTPIVENSTPQQSSESMPAAMDNTPPQPSELPEFPEQPQIPQSPQEG